MAETKTEAADAAAADEWEDVQIGLGREWDFDKNGALIAYYVDKTSVPLEDDADRTEAAARIFALEDTGEQVFLWDSYELATALDQVSQGRKVRIEFLGIDPISGKAGPRQVKRYKVQAARQ